MAEFSINSEPAGTTASKWSVCLVSLRTIDSHLSTGVGAREEFRIAKTQTGSVRGTVSEQNPPFPLSQ